MMITAFDVYLVMQFDSIKCGMNGLATFGLIGAAISSLGYLLLADEKDTKAACKRAVQWCAGVFVAAGLVGVFTPSTKTMAAMIILPAITSDEVVKPAMAEAGELYELAKQALRNAVEDKEKSER